MSTNQLSSSNTISNTKPGQGLLPSAGSDSGKVSECGILYWRPLFPLRKITMKICILICSSRIILADTTSFPCIKEKEGEVRYVSTKWVLDKREVLFLPAQDTDVMWERQS